MTLVAMVLLAGCGESHVPPLQPCDPELPTTCAPDEACRVTLDGEYLCMRTCDRAAGSVCATGEACINRIPGPPYVCCIGGPLERGEPCERHSVCGFSLLCNREDVCEQACTSPDFACLTPELRCISGVCQVPVPAGAPCDSPFDCDPYFRCTADTLFTCQPRCPEGGVCPDGSACRWDTSCPVGELPRVDTCERRPEGSIGCGEDEVCTLTQVGVRRCARAGCRPDGTGEVSCDAEACLPEPEDAEMLLCWPGGVVGLGEPCSGSHECGVALACNVTGVCAYQCSDEGEPCPAQGLHVCRNFVCTPERP